MNITTDEIIIETHIPAILKEKIVRFRQRHFILSVKSSTDYEALRWLTRQPNITIDVTRLPGLWDLPEHIAGSLHSDRDGLLFLPRTRTVKNLSFTQATNVICSNLEITENIYIPTASGFEASHLRITKDFLARNLTHFLFDELEETRSLDVKSAVIFDASKYRKAHHMNINSCPKLVSNIEIAGIICAINALEVNTPKLKVYDRVITANCHMPHMRIYAANNSEFYYGNKGSKNCELSQPTYVSIIAQLRHG